MKKLVTTPDGTIWYATVNEEKHMITGKKEDVTNNAVNEVANHMMLQKEFKTKGFFEYSYFNNEKVRIASICTIDPSYVVVKKDVFEQYEDAYKKMNESESKN